MLPPEIAATVERRYRLDIEDARRLSGGEESEVFRIKAPQGDFVLRLGPAWRTKAELDWSYALATAAHAQLPQVSAPIADAQGACVAVHEGRPVSLWPFVEGAPADRADTEHRIAAAAMLARLHRVLQSLPPRPPRPPTSAKARVMLRPAEDPQQICDAALDDWLARHPVRRAPIHGDAWPGNFLMRAGALVGVIDWDDARIGSPERELAWAAWEWCQDDDGRALDIDAAMRFLDAYGAAGGPVAVAARGFLIPSIRINLRFEIRHALGARERGDAFSRDDEDYLASELAAFETLRAIRIG